MWSRDRNVQGQTGIQFEGFGREFISLVIDEVTVRGRKSFFDLSIADDRWRKYMQRLAAADLKQKIVFLVEMKGRHRTGRRYEDKSLPPFHAWKQRLRMGFHFIQTLVQQRAVFGILFHPLQDHP